MPLIFLLSGNISSNRKQLPSFFSFCTGQEFSCPNDEKKKKIQKENDSHFQLNQSRGLCNFYSKGCTIWLWYFGHIYEKYFHAFSKIIITYSPF